MEQLEQSKKQEGKPSKPSAPMIQLNSYECFHVSNVIIIPVKSMRPGHKLFQNPNKNLPNPKIHEIQKSVKSKSPSNPKILVQKYQIQKSMKSKNPSPKILVQKS